MKFGEQMKIKRKMPMTVKADKLIALLERKFKRPIEKKQLLAILCRLGKYNNKQIQKISEFEHRVNEYLKEIKVMPRTAYRWIHMTLLPAEYLDQINRKKLTHRRAEVIYNNAERRRKANTGLEILKLGREIASRCLQ